MSMAPSPSGPWPVHIGEAARLAGLSAKMVRHYESLGLLGAVGRTDSGYRLYGETEVHRLRFVRRGRELGFSMAEIADLLELWSKQQRHSGQVKRLVEQHLGQLQQRISALQAMQRSLQTLLGCCPGDEQPDCPILDDLAGSPQRHSA